LKILNVNMSLDPVRGGGTAERTFQMSRFLARSGVKCTILTTGMGINGKRLEALEGIRVIVLPCLFERFYIPRFTFRHILSLVKESDLVHLMGHWTFINALVYSVTAYLHKPYVVCPAGALPVYGRSKWLKKFYNWVIGKRIIYNASGHIAITADEVFQFQQYGVHLDRVSVIPNGIDRENYLSKDDADFRNKYGLSNHSFILFVGRLNPIKGPDLLLDAFCYLKDRIQDYHLVFAGPDEGMLPMLKDMVTTHHIEDRVHFVGFLRDKDKSHAYHAADLLVIPSRQEAMSIVALEAGISGTPVLLTDCCGFAEVADCGGGKVVPATVEGLHKGLSNMMNNRESLKIMGENLKKYVKEHFIWDVISDKYLKLYQGILDER